MEEQQQQNLLKQLHYWGNTPDERKSTTISRNQINKVILHLTKRSLSLHQIMGTHQHPSTCLLPRRTFQATAIFLAQMGFACFAVDIEGHDRSQGVRASVPNVDLVVQDCLYFFNSIKQDLQFNGLPCFLYGESMGKIFTLL